MYTNPYVAKVIARDHEREMAKMAAHGRSGQFLKATNRAFHALVNQMRLVSENRIR